MTKISCISEPSHPYEYWKPPPARNQYHVDSQVMTNDFFFTYQTLSNKYISNTSSTKENEKFIIIQYLFKGVHCRRTTLALSGPFE